MVDGFDHHVATRWRPALPQPQVLEDSLDDRRVLDYREHPHLAAAPSAPQNVLPPPPAKKRGPGETASTPRAVGAEQVVSVGRSRIDSAI